MSDAKQNAPDIVKQVRTIASRGRMDDADVQIIFDAADEIDRLRHAQCSVCGESVES